MTSRPGWLRALAPLALMALIFYLSGQPSVGPDLPSWTRVIAHFTEYAVLAALWAWALTPGLGRRAVLLAAIVSLLYAISDEYHQSFIEGRDADPIDVAADAAGIAAALTAWVSWRPGRSRRTARRDPERPA